MADAGGGFITITVQFPDQAPLVQKLAAAGMATRDLSPAWEQVGEVLQRDFAENYRAEGGEIGPIITPKWRPLAPATVADRVRKGYGGAHPMLVRRGDLEASVIQRGAAGNVFDVQPDRVTVGTSNPIATYQHYGTSRGIPPRKLLGMSWETRSEIVRILNEYIRSQIAAAFGR